MAIKTLVSNAAKNIKCFFGLHDWFVYPRYRAGTEHVGENRICRNCTAKQYMEHTEVKDWV